MPRILFYFVFVFVLFSKPKIMFRKVHCTHFDPLINWAASFKLESKQAAISKTVYRQKHGVDGHIKEGEAFKHT